MRIGDYEFTEYQIGILWAISSYAEGRLVLRHKDRYFLDAINKSVGNTIYSQRSRTDIQYVLKIRLPLPDLENIGYTSRNSDIRITPEFAELDFFKAYLEIHSKADSHLVKTKGYVYTRKRLRVYGSYYILERLNYFLVSYGLNEKKIQSVNDKTMYLSYANQKELLKIYDLFFQDPCNVSFWDNYKNIIEGA